MYLAEISPTSLRGAVTTQILPLIIIIIIIIVIIAIIVIITIIIIIIIVVLTNWQTGKPTPILVLTLALQLGTVYQLIITMSILLSQVPST